VCGGDGGIRIRAAPRNGAGWEVPRFNFRKGSGAKKDSLSSQFSIATNIGEVHGIVNAWTELAFFPQTGKMFYSRPAPRLRLMKKRIAVIVSIGAALVALASVSSAQQRDLSFSIGVGGGDYHTCFAGGLSGCFPVAPMVKCEAEVFYYRMPAAKSKVEGLAITSTAVDVDLGLLLQAVAAGQKFVPYVVIQAGLIYESETWKFQLLKTKESHSYSLWNIGLGAGAKIRLGFRSGLRLDFRWLRVLGRDIQIPRASLGFFIYV
jgi:hypothetical protein